MNETRLKKDGEWEMKSTQKKQMNKNNEIKLRN